MTNNNKKVIDMEKQQSDPVGDYYIKKLTELRPVDILMLKKLDLVIWIDIIILILFIFGVVLLWTQKQDLTLFLQLFKCKNITSLEICF